MGIGLYFEDYTVGDEYRTTARTITEADIVLFAGLTGDYNPLHTDAEFAGQTPIGERIAHGALVFSYVGGLINQMGLGDGTAIALVDTTFKMPAPVKIGDTIRATIRVKGLTPTSKPHRGILVQEITVYNQTGAVVMEQQTTMMVKKRGSP